MGEQPPPPPKKKSLARAKCHLSAYVEVFLSSRGQSTTRVNPNYRQLAMVVKNAARLVDKWSTDICIHLNIKPCEWQGALGGRVGMSCLPVSVKAW